MPRLSAQRLLLFSAATAILLLTLLTASRYDGSTATALELPPESTLPPQGAPSTATPADDDDDTAAATAFEVEDEAGWEDACGGVPAPSAPPTVPVLKPADPVAGVGFDTVPVLPSPSEVRGGGAAAAGTPLETRYVAGPGHTEPLCYSELTNVCVAGGVLTLSVDAAVAGRHVRNGGLLSLCNEGASKGNHLHVRVAAAAAAGTSPSSGKKLYVLHCWQYYGYHLWQCLLGVWARFQRAGRGGAGEWWGVDGVLPDAQYALTFGMPRHGATDDAAGMFRRSPGGLAGAADEAFAPKAENAYFPLFRLLSPRAADFARLADLQTPRCYATAYAGSPNPYQATAEEWRGFLLHAKRMLRAGVAASGRVAALAALVAARGGGGGGGIGHLARAAAQPPQLVVTIVQRKRSYRILNAAHVLEAGHTLPLYYSSGEEGQGLRRQQQQPALRTEAAVVSWEDMPVLAQVAAAARTNVLVGVHGNGLTWLVFMPNAVFTAAATAAAAAKPRRAHRLHSAVVELWPSAEYKGDYKRMARMAGVHYLSVQHGAHETRSDVTVNLPLLRGALVRAARRILGGCGGGGAAASAAASPEAATAVGAWEDVYSLMRRQKGGYARRGVLKKHYKPVALRVALVGGWTDVLNRAHFELCGARDVRLRRFCTSYRDADAELRLRRRACVDDAALSAQAVASCLVSIDVLLLGRQQQNGTGGGGGALTEATWRVPAMVAEQQAREAAVADAQHAQASEEKRRAAGTWDSTGQAGGQGPVVLLQNPWLISGHNT